MRYQHDMDTKEPGARTNSPPQILLVDDDVDILDELAEGLTALDLPPLKASTAVEALAIVQRNPGLRVIVTDLQMPQIDGIELLQKLTARRNSRPLTAVVMTGNASLDRAVAALRLNAVDFLQKPVSAEEVAIAIRRALDLTGRARPEPSQSATESDYLRALVAARTDRDAIFKAKLFSDPAWDMMLDLAVAEATGRFVSVTSLCLASGVATTTALRRIDELQEADLIMRFPDETDRRRTLVRLTETGLERMHAFVERQAARLGLKVG
ncbi:MULTISPECIES: response regulator [Afifella]|uniref:response regulator n=1 Tax=Afifella TaxID=643217 RepID=UPI001FE2D8BC|nr:MULTISPECIES: response regulator [Afifella]MCT8267798.1 response regulator [Afifella sp. JA880]